MLLVLLACNGQNELGPDCPDDVTVEQLEAVGSVPVVTFSTDGKTEATVGWSVDDGQSAVAPAATASEHRFLLYGVPPLTDYTWTLTYEQDGETLTCEGEATNSGVTDPPAVEVTYYDPDLASPELYWLAVMPGVPSKIFVMDREGTILWNVVLGEDQVSADIRFARNGDILYNYFAESHYEDEGSIVRIGLDGEISEDLKTPLAHHVFTEREDGGLAYLAIDLRSWDPYGDIVGDAVYETTWDGGEQQIWTVWDEQDPEPHDGWDSTFYPQGKDWTHGNALTWDVDRQTYMVSLGGIDTLYELDLGGSVVRSYGTYGDIQTEGLAFNFQHDPHWGEDGKLRMVTSSEDFDAEKTWGVEYELDESAGILREVRTWGEDEGDHARVLGQLRALSNGNALVSWGSGGVMREYTPEGEVVWEVYTGAAEFFGNGVMFSDFYDPWSGANTLR